MVRFVFQVIKNQETPNIVCSFDNFRYIFNVPDGFQRFIKDNNIKINPGPRIFFTRNSTQTLSGCFGYLHTLLAQNCGISTKIYGPKGIYNLFNMKRYNEIGGFKTLPYSFQEINGKLLLGTKDTKLIEELLQQNDCLLQEFLEKIKEHIIDPAESNNASIFMKSPTLFQDENLQISCVETGNSIQYIVTCPQQKGNVSKEKLQNFQLSGKNMAMLMKKGIVETETGQIVRIEEIKEPDIIPQSVIILDIHNEEQLLKFLNSQEFSILIQKYQNKQENLVSIFHLSHTIHQPFYIDFLNKFKDINHVLCNYEQGEINEQALIHYNYQPLSEVISTALNEQFPLNFPQIAKIKLQTLPEQLKQHNNIFGYIPLFEYQICPVKQQGYKPVQNYTPKEVIKSIKQIAAQQVIEQPEQDFLKLIFLGTCSMKPGQYRNVSGIIVVNEKLKSNIILDCGEGTRKQIYDQQLDIIDKPLLIWISHAHSDHHMGVLQLLFDLSKSKQDIFLIIPAIVLPWITFYQTIIGEEFKCQIILSQQIDEDFKEDINVLVQSVYKQCRVRQGENIQTNQFINFEQNYVNLKQIMATQFGLQSIKVTSVEHCPQAYGIRLNFSDNRSITYSGDTRPCKQFVRLSQNTNILIHEATFSDDLEENAKQNMHSTISEAIQVGIESQADVIALTHYSQRYSKQIEIKQEHLLNDKVIFSCDHFGGYLNQYSYLSKMSKEIIQIFND